MDLIEPDLKFSPSGMVTPPDWGLILAEGPDVGTFLQGQLTNDVLLLPVGQARFSGYCSAKGRLMASFIVQKFSNEKYLLICHKDLLQVIIKRLSMFVMRAKVKLTDATSLYEMRGFLGATADLACPDLKAEGPWRAIFEGETGFIKLYSARSAQAFTTRLLWLGLKDSLDAQSFLKNNFDSAIASALATVNDWQLAEVLSGVSMVQTASSEAFVPQMLNYESVEGVSFKKGCYPGQEVVARSQFRGTLKRRAYIVSSQEVLQVGQEVFAADDAEQACGSVASAAKFDLAARQSMDSYWGIVSMQVSATEKSLHLGNANGPVLRVLALPYPLLEDI